MTHSTREPSAGYLVEVINAYCVRHMGRRPNLVDPQGYNDKINWLKVYDQMYEQVHCCNKLLAREFVAQRVGGEVLLRILQTGRSVGEIGFSELSPPYVLKSNHDSGSVYVIRGQDDIRKAKRLVARRLRRTYGVEKGEWAYSHIVPMVFVEEFMDGPIVDYKFHCSLGEIRWVQIIAERASGRPRETVVDADYRTLRLHMDHNMIGANSTPGKPGSWERMKVIARALSTGFRYVRVDLYDYDGRVVFGELTFWPLAGCYKTRDETRFGAMLEIDTANKRPVIHDLRSDWRIARRRGCRQWIIRRVRRVMGAR